MIEGFQDIGLEKDKLSLTIKNLKNSNEVILFYVEQNKKQNSFFNIKDHELILNERFFKQPYEVVFRSFTDSLKLIGLMYNQVRGKKIDNILKKIEENKLYKETLGGCVIKRINRTIIIQKE